MWTDSMRHGFPKTALQIMALALLIPGSSQFSLVFAQEPEPGDQAQMITAMRAYAEQYVDKLPNFICFQVIQEFESGKKTDHWRKRDKFTATLIFNQGREERS